MEILTNSKMVKIEEVLLARERLHIINEVDGKKIGEGVALDADILHWKYNIDMKGIDIVDGTHMIQIIVPQKGKKVELINMFRVEHGNYIFATDLVEKRY